MSEINYFKIYIFDMIDDREKMSLSVDVIYID
jgi:hypothetical protein